MKQNQKEKRKLNLFLQAILHIVTDTSHLLSCIDLCHKKTSISYYCNFFFFNDYLWIVI